MVAAVGLALWCALVVSTIDNVLRPRLVGEGTKMPDLLVLLGTLGGLILFGPVGILIGPIVAALFVTVWQLWGGAARDTIVQTPAPEAASSPGETVADQRPPEQDTAASRSSQ